MFIVQVIFNLIFIIFYKDFTNTITVGSAKLRTGWSFPETANI